MPNNGSDILGNNIYIEKSFNYQESFFNIKSNDTEKILELVDKLNISVSENEIKNIESVKKTDYKQFSLIENHYIINNCFLEPGFFFKTENINKILPFIKFNIKESEDAKEGDQKLREVLEIIEKKAKKNNLDFSILKKWMFTAKKTFVMKQWIIKLKKIVFYEGFNKLPEANTATQAIEKGGDPGLALWLANKSGIKYECPEPDPNKEIETLKTEFEKVIPESELANVYGCKDEDIVCQYCSSIIHYNEQFCSSCKKYIELGNKTVKVLPVPGELQTCTSPPWLEITCFTIERPNPVPPVSRERAESTR